jgi:hypothetical protein
MLVIAAFLQNELITGFFSEQTDVNTLHESMQEHICFKC